MNLDYVKEVCEGLCESPHDFPAKWACMIFGYFDESFEVPEGFVVLAGFVGNKRSWKEYVRRWDEVLNGYPLHMRKLRLGGKNAERRWGEKLELLGAIPKEVGLRPFAGSVRISDYRHLIKGTIADIVLAGYPVALLAMLDAILNSDLPSRDRIELIFEQQTVFAVDRERTIALVRKMPQHIIHHGKSRIAKSSSIEKSILLEASDYLAYAVLYQLINPNSQQAVLTSPILRAYGKPIPHHATAEYQIIETIKAFREGMEESELSQIDRDRKAYIKHWLKKDLEEGMRWTDAITKTSESRKKKHLIGR